MRLEALSKMSIVPAGGQKVQNKIAKGVGDSLAVMQKRHKQHEIIKGGKGKPQPGKWTKRTNAGLSRSFHISWNKGDLSGSYGSDLRRSWIIEKGGTIWAKDAPFLVFKTHDGSWHSVKSVTLPPRPTLDNAAKNSAADRERIMGKALMDGVWSSL